MTTSGHTWVRDLPEYRDCVRVFADRAEAGAVLAGMLREYEGSDALVLAIPAGGVRVGGPLAMALGLPLDVAVCSKITPPGNTEVGYGAVCFDGTVQVNQPSADELGLSEKDIAEGIAAATDKVKRRVMVFRGIRPFPTLAGRTVILVDDGLASGVTMSVAIEAVRKSGAQDIVVAVPTAHTQSVDRLKGKGCVRAVYCANLRGGWSFAVADAYRRWYDVSEEEVVAILKAQAGKIT